MMATRHGQCAFSSGAACRARYDGNPCSEECRRNLAKFHSWDHGPSPALLADDLQAHPTPFFLILVLLRLAIEGSVSRRLIRISEGCRPPATALSHTLRDVMQAAGAQWYVLHPDANLPRPSGTRFPKISECVGGTRVWTTALSGRRDNAGRMEGTVGTVRCLKLLISQRPAFQHALNFLSAFHYRQDAHRFHYPCCPSCSSLCRF